MGIDPMTDFAELIFGEGSQLEVVQAVGSGKVDAGAVRTDMLERMMSDGEISLSDFKVLNAKTSDGFPFLHSSQLYPEWPFIKMKGSDETLAELVALALLQMPNKHPAAIAGKYIGWTVPLDYQPVHDLLRDLRIGPYENYGKITLLQAIKRAWVWLSLLLLGLTAAITATIYIYQSRRKLATLSNEQVKINWALAERIKEMTCLYQISDVLAEVNSSREGVFRAILELIPPAWQFPDKTFARITFGDTQVTTAVFNVSENFLRADIRARDTIVGRIEVFYPDLNICPSCLFLPEETTLINEIAKRIGQFLHRQNMQQDLLESQRNLERKVSLRTKELRDAKDSAERASRAKSEFLSRMSHELRTPLNSILGYAQIIQAQSDDTAVSECKEDADQIIRASRHLRELINETLDLAKIESGKFSVNVEPTNIHDIFDQAIAVIKPLTLERNLTLLIERDAPSPLFVNCDPMRTKQVMLNLLSNAVKYNRDQGTVTVSLSTHDGKLRFTVKDSGIGIRNEDVKLIFQPFERLANNHHIEGTGIGLTVSKHIVEQMGGTLQFDSVFDEGSVFWFDLKISN
jgi:signal transduction histidine kinase